MLFKTKGHRYVCCNTPATLVRSKDKTKMLTHLRLLGKCNHCYNVTDWYQSGIRSFSFCTWVFLFGFFCLLVLFFLRKNFLKMSFLLWELQGTYLLWHEARKSQGGLCNLLCRTCRPLIPAFCVHSHLHNQGLQIHQLLIHSLPVQLNCQRSLALWKCCSSGINWGKSQKLWKCRCSTSQGDDSFVWIQEIVLTVV